MMKTSQDQQGQQDYEDGVTDERQMTVGFAKVLLPSVESIPAVVGCTAEKKMFRVFIGYYSISP